MLLDKFTNFSSIGQLEQAIDTNDIVRVKAMMTRNPALHRAPLGLPVSQLLIERGADLSVRVKLPGDYERPGEIVECTALGYALLFGGPQQRRTVTLLRERGAVE